MADHSDLEEIYTHAKSALKAREYDRARDLLASILAVDENYKDASRLLDRVVREKRRHWYNDVRLWGTVIGLAVIGLLVWVIPKLSLQAAPAPDASKISSMATTIPTDSTIPTVTPSALPSPITLTWKRISLGQEFARDTVTSIAMDPKDSEVLYAGTQHAGIYKSIDGGLSWKPALNGLEATQVTSLAIDPSDSSRLYAGTRAGVFKTEDGGENWSKVGPGISLVMDPQNGSHLYARDDGHVYESTDQGRSWESVYSSQGNCPDTVLSLAIHPLNGKTLFAGGGEGCKVGEYLSDDSGRTWTLLRDAEITNPGLDALTLGLDQLIVGLDRQGNYSIQAGGTAFDSTGSVYSDCDGHLCLFNEDEDQNITLGKPDVGVFTNIAISPHDPKTIYVSGKGISVSKDGGLTWAKLNNGLGATLLALETGSGNPSALYLQVEECNERNRTHSGPPKNPKPEPGQPLYISNNNGQTWDLAIQTGCYLIKDANGTTLYRTGQSYAWIEGSTDWTVWLWRSRDAGKSWEKVFTPAFVGTLTADLIQNGLLYIENGGGTNAAHDQYISKDYGNKWTAKDPSENKTPCHGTTLHFIDKHRPMTIDPRDGNHVFVIDNGALLESHNSCDTREASASAPNTNMNSIVFDTTIPGMLYAGTDQGAYISTDDGATWDQINDGLLGATVVYSIVVDPQSNVYAATPYGIFKLESK